MDADEFVEIVRKEKETALSRLGSSKSLYAATKGEMDADAVLEAAANAEYDAHETFSGWAEDEENDAAREAFADTAEEERDHYEQVRDRLGVDEQRSSARETESHGGFDPAHDPSAMQELLRGCDDTVSRAGGFVGRTLATEKSKSQMTGFFVGQADPGTAQLFRDLGDDVDEQLARGKALLSEVCVSDDDWTRAQNAANEAIEAAYEEYTESLKSMGVNPKPVC